jgi:hypothetical protein
MSQVPFACIFSFVLKLFDQQLKYITIYKWVQSHPNAPPVAQLTVWLNKQMPYFVITHTANIQKLQIFWFYTWRCSHPKGRSSKFHDPLRSLPLAADGYYLICIFFSHPSWLPSWAFPRACVCVCVGAAVEISLFTPVRGCRIVYTRRRSYTCCCQSGRQKQADLRRARREQTWESCYLFYFLFLRQPRRAASSPHTRNSSLAASPSVSLGTKVKRPARKKRERDINK